MTSTATLVNQAVARGQVQEQIKHCISCTYSAACKSPIPFRGPTPTRFMMLGASPSALEDRAGRLLVGGDGQAMAQRLLDAGLPPLEKWFVGNVVSCKPPGDKIDAWAIAACVTNLRALVELADPEWVLLLGGVALAAVGLKGKLAEIHGKWVDVPYGVFKDRKVLATFDPVTTLRDTSKAAAISGDLAVLAALIQEPGNAAFRLTPGRNGKLR